LADGFGGVGKALLPAGPEDAEPGAGEDADGMRMIAAAGARLLVDVRGPVRGVSRMVGNRGMRESQALITRPAEGDATVFSAGARDREDPRFGGEMVVRDRSAPAGQQVGDGAAAGGARVGEEGGRATRRMLDAALAFAGSHEVVQPGPARSGDARRVNGTRG